MRFSPKQNRPIKAQISNEPMLMPAIAPAPRTLGIGFELVLVYGEVFEFVDVEVVLLVVCVVVVVVVLLKGSMVPVGNVGSDGTALVDPSFVNVVGS